MMSAQSESRAVAAIVVTYHPDAKSLHSLISALDSEGVRIIIADNGGGRAALPQQSSGNLSILDLGENRGLGAAINAGIAEARRAQASHVVTFDQDSNPSPGMIRRLLGEFERQRGLGVKVGAVGPLFVDTRQKPPLLHPFIRLGIFGSGHRFCSCESEMIAVDTLITSGCMTSMDVLVEVGPMSESYFVDYTDIEWCFRASAKGFSLFGVCGARMVHELGGGKSRSILGLNLFEYSPVRRYYYARNTIAVSALSYVRIRWKVRLLIGLLLRGITLPFAPRSARAGVLSEYKMFLRGALDGLRGVSGGLKLGGDGK